MRLQKWPLDFSIYGTFIFFLIKLNVINERNVYPFSMIWKDVERHHEDKYEKSYPRKMYDLQDWNKCVVS